MPLAAEARRCWAGSRPPYPSSLVDWVAKPKSVAALVFYSPAGGSLIRTEPLKIRSVGGGMTRVPADENDRNGGLSSLGAGHSRTKLRTSTRSGAVVRGTCSESVRAAALSKALLVRQLSQMTVVGGPPPQSPGLVAPGDLAGHADGVGLLGVVLREDIEDLAQRYRRLRKREHRGGEKHCGDAFPTLASDVRGVGYACHRALKGQAMVGEIELVSDGDGLVVTGDRSAVERFLDHAGLLLNAKEFGLGKLSTSEGGVAAGRSPAFFSCPARGLHPWLPGSIAR